jgi:pyridoxal phosphate enzyme (YggS family)
VVGKVDLIHSVDSERLLRAVQTQAEKLDIVQDILLEVNIGREEAKGGILPQELSSLLDKIENFPNVRVKGLMAIPPICQKDTDNDKFFQEMCKIGVDIMEKKYDNVSVDILSMGMSDDFVRAIACGSTMIRIGTAIFGARDYTKSHQT